MTTPRIGSGLWPHSDRFLTEPRDRALSELPSKSPEHEAAER